MLNVIVRIRPYRFISKYLKKKNVKNHFLEKLFPSLDSQFYVVSSELLKGYVLTGSTRPIKQIPYFRLHVDIRVPLQRATFTNFSCSLNKFTEAEAKPVIAFLAENTQQITRSRDPHSFVAPIPMSLYPSRAEEELA